RPRLSFGGVTLWSAPASRVRFWAKILRAGIIAFPRICTIRGFFGAIGSGEERGLPSVQQLQRKCREPVLAPAAPPMKLSEERLSTVILYSAGNEWRFKGSTTAPGRRHCLSKLSGLKLKTGLRPAALFHA